MANTFFNKFPIFSESLEESKMFAKFRGKTAKETYRFVKGVIITRSITGPAMYAVSVIPTELSKGFIYSAIGSVGESFLGYISGVGFVRWLYKASDVSYIKNTARVLYNFGCLPMTIYSKGITAVFDVTYLSKLEEKWFGCPIYLFDDNRLWVEGNFTLEDALTHVGNGGNS
jgi:hypothetical protein